mmetsp:Transcript_3013/g.5690  ORF Transcript_3013/g.5690 Transcript_3013/m.5690 type:complete len:174 (+) Transcript_3013:35-556(+)
MSAELYSYSLEPAPCFRGVDDRIRGGRSISHASVEGKRLRFYGHLDIEALGGAGFASQCTPTSISFSKFAGVRFKVYPSSSETNADNPKTFVLSLKTTLPETRPDGRNKARVAYEYSFSRECKEAKIIVALWKDFLPTYRGRPYPKASSLISQKSAVELSWMCRSNFGQQGRF